MSDDKRYVLCMRYADGAILYISGPDPAGARGSKDVHEAMVFPSPQEAIAFRDRLPHQGGDFATQYTVHEWKPEGYVVPI